MTNQLVAMKIPRPATVPVTTPLASALLFVAICQAPNRDPRYGPDFGPSVARSPWPCLFRNDLPCFDLLSSSPPLRVSGPRSGGVPRESLGAPRIWSERLLRQVAFVQLQNEVPGMSDEAPARHRRLPRLQAMMFQRPHRAPHRENLLYGQRG